MKRIWIFVLICIAFSIIFISVQPNTSASMHSLEGLKGDVSRGAYLARASGCIACHTDIKNGGAPLAGGAPLKTPFGTFYGPNLTTDKVHGIGSWSVDDFAKALRQGKSPEGNSYYPAFPYTFYTKLNDQDIADLWAAFKTVPANAQTAPSHDISFPFNVRSSLSIWQSLFFEQGRFNQLSIKDEKYVRGAYLVESATHCGACHTARNLVGALKNEPPFTGSQSLLEGEGNVPSITREVLREKGWTEQDLSYALKSGVKHDGDVFGGSMGEVVRDGTAFMQKSDLDAIAYYLFNRE